MSATAVTAAAATAALGKSLAHAAESPAAPSPTPALLAPASPLQNAAWVWRFDDDGSPASVRDTLQSNGLSVVLKTNQGADWMGRWHHFPEAITGPEKLSATAAFFESGG